jgi:hypothetical protein
MVLVNLSKVQPVRNKNGVVRTSSFERTLILPVQAAHGKLHKGSDKASPSNNVNAGPETE